MRAGAGVAAPATARVRGGAGARAAAGARLGVGAGAGVGPGVGAGVGPGVGAGVGPGVGPGARARAHAAHAYAAGAAMDTDFVLPLGTVAIAPGTRTPGSWTATMTIDIVTGVAVAGTIVAVAGTVVAAVRRITVACDRTGSHGARGNARACASARPGAWWGCDTDAALVECALGPVVDQCRGFENKIDIKE